MLKVVGAGLVKWPKEKVVKVGGCAGASRTTKRLKVVGEGGDAGLPTTFGKPCVPTTLPFSRRCSGTHVELILVF